MITIDQLKENLEDLGYLSTDEILYDAFNALYMFEDNKIDVGQDIFAICLEGPPGAGKTEFAEVYTKLANRLFGNVKMVSYQCDATTGKTELFEDINISAAIRNDADNVNIPGKLVEAITEVNKGNRVVLFIDEYDKAREETDAFMLQFLQSGKINSTQHGDLQVKDEYKSNLQVILCKNDMREELSGPLSRRIRILRLDYMTPEMFYTIANRVLVKNNVDDGLINLVSVMYKIAYKSKEVFDRLPSCSEMLRAISDADRLTKIANAPQSIIYKTIMKNMFKSVDDISTFETGLGKTEDGKKVEQLIESMKKDTTPSSQVDLNTLISSKLLVGESNKLSQKTEQMNILMKETKEKFARLEAQKRIELNALQNNKNIVFQNGKLVATDNIPSYFSNFSDSTSNVKRGVNIFDDSYGEWTDVAQLSLSKMSHQDFIAELVKNASKMGVVVCENGVVIKQYKDQKIIMFADKDKENNVRYRFMSNYPVVPSVGINHINTMMTLLCKYYELQLKQRNIKNPKDDFKYSFNGLIYNDSKLKFNAIIDNVYNLVMDGNYNDDEKSISKVISKLECNNIDNAVFSSLEILKQSEAKNLVK